MFLMKNFINPTKFFHSIFVASHSYTFSLFMQLLPQRRSRLNFCYWATHIKKGQHLLALVFSRTHKAIYDQTNRIRPVEIPCLLILLNCFH